MMLTTVIIIVVVIATAAVKHWLLVAIVGVSSVGTAA